MRAPPVSCWPARLLRRHLLLRRPASSCFVLLQPRCRPPKRAARRPQIAPGRSPTRPRRLQLLLSLLSLSLLPQKRGVWSCCCFWPSSSTASSTRRCTRRTTHELLQLSLLFTCVDALLLPLDYRPLLCVLSSPGQSRPPIHALSLSIYRLDTQRRRRRRLRVPYHLALSSHTILLSSSAIVSLSFSYSGLDPRIYRS